MYRELKEYITQRIQEFDSIPAERKKTLREVADFVAAEINKYGTVKLNFICTHNSRRSHLAQIWTQTAAAYYEIEGVETFSGGTEATAFNPRAVAAIERAGFHVENPGGDNPRYNIRFADGADPMLCFSKTFDDKANPDQQFAAIMTCSDADENCPFVPGASYRKPVTYRDPKESDGTEREEEIYDERCRQIAAEMLYMMNQVASA
jgi:arsenate reductase (thioredoxin)